MEKIFVWGYWVKNYGDDLFLKSFINSINLKKFKVYIYSEKKYKSYYENIGLKVICYDSFKIRLFSRIAHLIRIPDYYFLKVNKKDIFVMLGGSLFAENKGDVAELIQIRNLSYAISHSKKSYVIGSNFGPYKNKSFYNNYLRLFGKVNNVSFRDKKSYDLFKDKLKNISYGQDIVLEGVWDKNIIYDSKGKNCIAISLIDLSTRASIKKHCNSYENFIVNVCNYYLDKGENIIFISFCDKEGDLTAINRVIERVKSKKNKERINVVSYTNINSIANVINNCKMIIATRFHAVILGLYFKKTIIPIVYNKKIKYALDSYLDKYNAIDIEHIELYNISDLNNYNNNLMLKRNGTSQLYAFKKDNEL